MNLNKDELIFGKHIVELAYSAYHKEARVYTDFLSLGEISIFHAIKKDIPAIPYSTWGGTDDSERLMICFHGDAMNDKKMELVYPISCIHIVPANARFSDELNHRDYLGAILNLGIMRSKIGDILLDDNEAYVFCEHVIGRYILDNINKVKHMNVRATLCNPKELDIRREFEVIKGNVSSIRLDSMIKTAFGTSRNHVIPYIDGGKVQVNGREVVQNGHNVKEGDVVSVRGMGKFRYIGQNGLTKKGKISITIEKYI